MVWRARKPLPSALRSSAGDCLARQRAPVHEHRLRSWVSDCAPTGCSFVFSFIFLCSFCSCAPFSHLILQKSLRQVSRVIRQTRLCRLAVFRVTPIVSHMIHHHSVTLPSSVPSQRTEELWRVKRRRCLLRCQFTAKGTRARFTTSCFAHRRTRFSAPANKAVSLGLRARGAATGVLASLR